LSVLYKQFSYIRESDALSIPLEFFGELSKALIMHNILELTNVPYLLSAYTAERAEQNLTVICREKAFSEILGKIFLGRVNCANELSAIEREAPFDLIIFQEFMGLGRALRQTCQKISDDFLPRLSPKGFLFWLTGSAVISNSQGRETLARMSGVNVWATIDVPSGILGSNVAGCIIIFGREPPTKRLAASLRDEATAREVAKNFAARAINKKGPTWEWLDSKDWRTFSVLEAERRLRSLLPRGRFDRVPLRELVKGERIVKADKLRDGEFSPGTSLFIPEYAGSKVTTRFEDQSVKPRAVYCLEVNVERTSPRFLAFILNGEYGKELLLNISQGATIQRIAFRDLLSLNIPLPSLKSQNELTGVEADISLLQATLTEMRSTVARDWKQLPTVIEKIDEIKSTIDLEQKINNWWRELPYPLATIYRRYKIEPDPNKRLETLLHFFEVAAVFVATIATSHVRALRSDWQPVLASWMHPQTGNPIERADFGFWANLASTSLKGLRRILSDDDLRAGAIVYAGAELINTAEFIVALSDGFRAIDAAREFRNSWKAHGGLIKSSDAERLEAELQTQLREYYEIAAAVFRRLWLVRPGKAETGENGFRYECQKLVGSDPMFSSDLMELSHPVVSKALTFWLSGSRVAVKALPFLRLGFPQRTSESSLYVFNRVEKSGFRWVTYQEAHEQEIFEPDQELASLLALKSAGNP
jgi:hypothetical protein